MNILESVDTSSLALAKALGSSVPIVAILGQSVGIHSGKSDPILTLAMEKVGQTGHGWSNLLTRTPLDQNFYQWLTERYTRSIPSDALLAVADIPVSAVFTSSIDPRLHNLFNTNGRESVPILIGNPTPTVLRSLRRPPVFYLFGRAGTGSDELDPPTTRQALSQRRHQHSVAMLLNVRESATILGLILIDGYCPNSDWLRGEDLLAELASAPRDGVIWFGDEPNFEGDDAETYNDLINAGVIIRDTRSLGEVYTFLLTINEVASPQQWDEPEIISLHSEEKFVVSSRLRLLTEASALIVDNSWTGFLPPFSPELDRVAFHSFHSANIGARALVEGIRREYTFQRDFENVLWTKVEKALAKHSEPKGAIVLHGQSGVGKTIALGRLAIFAREKTKSAVLMILGSRVPQPTEVAPFLEAVNKFSGATLLIVDGNCPVYRYDDLLSALRSGGHKVVIVGTSYKLESQSSLFVHAPASLGLDEQNTLLELAKRFSESVSFDYKTDHALAKFYWCLPESRGGIADGLSREARAVETALRLRGAKPRPKAGLNALGYALIDAGYRQPTDSLFPSNLSSSELDLNSPAAKVIDYVMVVSRLHKAVPINLLLRTVLSPIGNRTAVLDVETLRELFEGEDLFRWLSSGVDQSELLISSRLQIEALLVCNRRLGTPDAEADLVMELIAHAYRAGPEDSEESHFVTEIVYALGPDGPAADRYKNSYLNIARGLSELRKEHGVLNARLMLQESALRRAYLRTNEISTELKMVILEEAMQSVNDALTATELPGTKRLYIAKRTREYLLTERAATYGFLATESAQSEGHVNDLWASYYAARDAARLAAGRVFSYQPLDILLWVPIRILREATKLTEAQRAELQADIRATLDIVDPTTLPSSQAILFNKQQIYAAEVLNDTQLSDEAFSALENAGSPVGFYLKARALAPTRPNTEEAVSNTDIQAAEQTAAYLTSVFPKISNDLRSIQLLISMEWIKATGRWMFRGLRQPLPFDPKNRDRISSLLRELKEVDEEGYTPQFRYINAVMLWLIGEKEAAIGSWRELARDTEYVEARRVANRHTITDASGKPIIFSGVVTKLIGDGRWNIKIQELDREVNLLENDFSGTEIAIGRTVRNFAISFSYRGPIADVFALRGY